MRYIGLIGLRNQMGRLISILVLTSLFGGCSHLQMHRPAPAQSNAQAMKQVMKRKDQIVLLSSPELENKPVLLLLHGATDDPTEMMDIVKDCAGKYNVLLYAYNQHHNIEKLAWHFVRE